MTTALINGFGMGAGLIIAIGAQNAFVLTQGVRREHHMAVALLCALCDAVLIALGVAGMGTLVSSHPTILTVATWGGALFLFTYGLRSFWSAYKGGTLRAGEVQTGSLKKILLITLGLTLLNPHVYLDTVVLLGSISGQFAPDQRIWFAVGAMSASLVWFLTLSAGGQLLAPLFKKQTTWRLLDTVVGCTMWFVGAGLLLR